MSDYQLEDNDSQMAYSLGLVSAMSTKLLSARQIQALAQENTVAEVITSLDNTEYGTPLHRTGLNPTLPALEQQLELEYAKAVKKVTESLPQKQKKAVNTLIKTTSDLANIKVATRTIRSKNPNSQTPFSSSGTITNEELTKLQKLPDPREIAQRLPPEYRKAYETALREKTPAEFEDELDRQFTKILLSTTSDETLEYARLMVDAINIRTILSFRQNDADPRKHLLAGGKYLSEHKLNHLIRQDNQGTVNALSDTPYQKPVSETINQEHPLTTLDARLSKVIDSQISENAMRKPMSADTVILYLRQKQDEIRRIRTILAAKTYGLEKEKTEAMIS